MMLFREHTPASNSNPSFQVIGSTYLPPHTHQRSEGFVLYVVYRIEKTYVLLNYSRALGTYYHS